MYIQREPAAAQNINTYIVISIPILQYLYISRKVLVSWAPLTIFVFNPVP